MKIPEIPCKTPRKIPDGFTVKYNGTARESRFLLLKSIVKSRKVLVKFRGNFPENSRKIPGKFPENSRKTPGKLRMFFTTNVMLQSENHSFYYYESNETP
jgi:hypothetical protein